MFLILVSGCVNGLNNEDQYIVAQKRIGEEHKYQDFNEITDNELVQKAKKILNKIDWEIAKVDMVRPADFRFIFQNKNPDIEAKAVLYELWVSPNNKKIELVIDAESKYTQLNEKDSADLFEILTGERLSDFKEKDPFLKIREVAWNFLKEKGWQDRAKEEWESSTVSEIIINNDYELLDKSYEGKEVLSVTFEDKENVVVGTPKILVDPIANKVIGFIPVE